MYSCVCVYVCCVCVCGCLSVSPYVFVGTCLCMCVHEPLCACTQCGSELAVTGLPLRDEERRDEGEVGEDVSEIPRRHPGPGEGQTALWAGLRGGRLTAQQ